MLLAYSARSKSGGRVERSQAGLYLMGGFLAGYVPPKVAEISSAALYPERREADEDKFRSRIVPIWDDCRTGVYGLAGNDVSAIRVAFLECAIAINWLVHFALHYAG